LNLMLDWNDLRYFLAVAREGSTIAAANSLKVNQSTVQRRFAALEESLGRKLIERTPTGYRLTELGQRLQPHAEGVEAAVAAFERQIASADTELTGTIRITSAEGLAYLVLTPLLEAFRTRYPGLKVDAILTERKLDLSKGEADVALRTGDLEDSALIGRKLADLAWAVYASRDYAERYGPPQTAADIEKHPVIRFDGELSNIHAARWLRTIAPGAKAATSSNSVTGMLLALKSGAGLATLPVHIGDYDADLVRVLDPVPELMSPMSLLAHPDLLKTPRVRAFFDFMIAEIETLRPMLMGKPRT
jgi:DNA-binding transcriptional LysR family regulator